ncbi:NOP protein chaperone 1 isoform X2 [Pseudorca crassidens]|uniref:NOP protein chaperone 1 isoform X2 n=1 Tax=Pseudorca crassidens TaxID=82174 RepID=UPI00352E7C7E
MEAHGESQPDASCSSFTRDGSGVSVSRELLTAGSGGRGGIWDRLLINSKPNSRKNSTLQTVRIERSPLLDQVQSFLPQMAQANEKLRKEMAAAPPGHFNIENIDETVGKVIQMAHILFLHWNSLYDTRVWTALTPLLRIISDSSADLAALPPEHIPNPAISTRHPPPFL